MLLEDSFGADVFGFVVAFVYAEVVLAGELVFAVVGVFVLFGFDIADALARAIGAGLWRGVGIAQVHRDGQNPVCAHIIKGSVDRSIGGVGFGTAGEIGRALGDGDAGFGHADAFGEIPAGLGDHDCSWISVADVFACENC